MSDNITVAILAGGHSRRMGSDKSFVKLYGRPLIEHVLERVALLGHPVILIANVPEPYRRLGQPVFPDVVPEKGSLGGLYTALFHSPTQYTLCVACDMPFLDPRLLSYLIDSRPFYDAVVPIFEGRPQGLHAVYNKVCMPRIYESLGKQQLRISDLFYSVRAKFITESDLRQGAFDLYSFTNLNTLEDVYRLEMLYPYSSSQPDG